MVLWGVDSGFDGWLRGKEMQDNCKVAWGIFHDVGYEGFVDLKCGDLLIVVERFDFLFFAKIFESFEWNDGACGNDACDAD